MFTDKIAKYYRHELVLPSKPKVLLNIFAFITHSCYLKASGEKATYFIRLKITDV